MKAICVLGLGYIGLPTATLFANQGIRVIGVDTNAIIVQKINGGRIHIEEVGLRTLVEGATRSGMLSAALSPQAADVFIITVPTPIGPHKEPDLTAVYAAVEAILPLLLPGNLVILESTIPPGTTDDIESLMAKRREDLRYETSKGGQRCRVLVAHCPERVLPGNIVRELVENDRVIGGTTPEATRVAVNLYRKIVSGNIYETDATTAEMVKLSENTFRDVNIALSNELAVICHKLGIDVWRVIELANRHPRVNLLRPGPGVGGHCIAVDPWFIVSGFPQDAQLIKAARHRNDSMPNHVANLIESLVSDIGKPKIACLGAAYKGNVGDARNSPSVEILKVLSERLSGRGEVALNDMHLDDLAFPLRSLDDVLADANLVVLLTDHIEYRDLDPAMVASRVRHKRLLDTRSVLDVERWRAAGFDVHRLGVGRHI